MSEDLGGQEVLAPQLGTEPEILSDSLFDMSILSVIDPKHIRPLLYFQLLADNGDVNAASIVRSFLKFRVSSGGRGRRDIIRMEGVRHGGGTNVESEIEKPGWIERNITERNWEQKERDRLGIDTGEK